MVSKLQHGNKNSAYFLTSYENYIHHKRILESMNANTLAENSNSHVNGRLLEWFTYKSKVDSFQLPKKKKRKRKANSFNYTCCANCFWIKMLIIGQHSWSSPRNYGNEIWKPSWSIGLLLASTAISKASMSSQL